MIASESDAEWVDGGPVGPRVASAGEDAFQTVQIATQHGLAEATTTSGRTGRALTLVFGPPGPPPPPAGEDDGQGEELRGDPGGQSCCRSCSPTWTRTTDMVINSHPLYRLSYWGRRNKYLTRERIYVNNLLH